MEKLSAHDFALKSSSQMARPELTLVNSFLAFSIHRNRQPGTSIHRRKLERVQQQRNLHMGTTTMHVVSMCKLHVIAAPAPTCADGCWCPVPLTFSNLHWWCFSFQQPAQTLYLHLWRLLFATCAGGLFPSTTCAYTNLHCVVVVYRYIYYRYIFIL